MTLDWSAVEEHLYNLAVEALGDFAAEHPDEVFYGFAIQGNALFGEVRLCLNTEEALRSQAAENFPYFSQQEIDEQLRWDLERWAYPGFNLRSPAHENRWDERWWPIQDRIQEHVLQDEESGREENGKNPTAARFLATLGRVLLRMETSGAFDRLRRTGDFRVLLRDDAEPLEQSWERLARLRNEQPTDPCSPSPPC